MNGILDAAVEVDQRLQQTGLPYCLIGGIALQRWGQPRTTLAVDVTVMTEFGNEEPAIEQLVDLLIEDHDGTGRLEKLFSNL